MLCVINYLMFFWKRENIVYRLEFFYYNDAKYAVNENVTTHNSQTRQTDLVENTRTCVAFLM